MHNTATHFRKHSNPPLINLTQRWSMCRTSHLDVFLCLLNFVKHWSEFITKWDNLRLQAGKMLIRSVSKLWQNIQSDVLLLLKESQVVILSKLCRLLNLSLMSRSFWSCDNWGWCRNILHSRRHMSLWHLLYRWCAISRGLLRDHRLNFWALKENRMVLELELLRSLSLLFGGYQIKLTFLLNLFIFLSLLVLFHTVCLLLDILQCLLVELKFFHLSLVWLSEVLSSLLFGFKLFL